MELAKYYYSRVTKDTPSRDRLALSEALVTDLTGQLDRGVEYDRDAVGEIARVLLSVNLDSLHSTPELRDWLLSQEVRDLVWRLSAQEGTASAVLQGMFDGVAERSVGFDDMWTWSTVLVSSWFLGTDGSVVPTSPGFLLLLFAFCYRCGSRQADYCGQRLMNIPSSDERLLPLVTRTLHTETWESLVQGNSAGDTVLHIAASLTRLPRVTRTLLYQTDIDVNVRGNTGKTPLTRLIGGSSVLYSIHLPPAEVLLEYPETDVSLLDDRDKTVLHYCLDHLGDSPASVTVALALITLICQHSSVTPDMISRALESLLEWEFSPGLRDQCYGVIVNLATNNTYDINRPVRGGMTACHLAATQGHYAIVEKFMDITGLDPNTPDSLGNTVLYYACANFPPESVMSVIDHPTATWDFTHKNKADQTILDYYSRLPDNKKDPTLLGYIEKCLEDTKGVRWVPFRPSGHIDVKCSTAEHYADRADDWTYEMGHAYKGKAGIIAIHTFSGNMNNLLGYKQDTKDLAALWDGLGFQVVVPERRNPEGGCLTAEEIQSAIKQFAREVLERIDQCAVLCILSHGGDGFLYGSDGHTADTNQLLQELDNINCIQMAGKPKVVIFQACQGDWADHGVHLRAGSNPLPQAAAGGYSETHLPSVSDTIVCTPSSRGYVSFVSDRSFYIRTLVKIFAQFACTEDVYRLLTMVNREVSKDTVRAITPGSTIPTDHKQMPHFGSTLRNTLYFFPCPGGKDGTDWQT